MEGLFFAPQTRLGFAWCREGPSPTNRKKKTGKKERKTKKREKTAHTDRRVDKHTQTRAAESGESGVRAESCSRQREEEERRREVVVECVFKKGRKVAPFLMINKINELVNIKRVKLLDTANYLIMK